MVRKPADGRIVGPVCGMYVGFRLEPRAEATATLRRWRRENSKSYITQHFDIRARCAQPVAQEAQQS